MIECASEFAEITWHPGDENNDEVIAFFVYYNTSFDAEGEYHLGAEVNRGTQSAKVGYTHRGGGGKPIQSGCSCPNGSMMVLYFKFKHSSFP